MGAVADDDNLASAGRNAKLTVDCRTKLEVYQNWSFRGIHGAEDRAASTGSIRHKTAPDNNSPPATIKGHRKKGVGRLHQLLICRNSL